VSLRVSAQSSAIVRATLRPAELAITDPRFYRSRCLTFVRFAPPLLSAPLLQTVARGRSLAAMSAGDWVLTCTEGLEDVTIAEVVSLGGAARVLAGGVVGADAGSLSSSDALRLRCVDTLGVLVGVLPEPLTGAVEDVDAFKTLAHPTSGAWGADANRRWSAALARWGAAREAAVARHGERALPGDRPPPSPPARAWLGDAHDPDDDDASDVFVDARDGRLRRVGYAEDETAAAHASRVESAGAAADATTRFTTTTRESLDASARVTAFGLPPRATYRVECRRSQAILTPSNQIARKHAYGSTRVAAELGWSVGAARPRWRVDLQSANAVVDAFVVGAVGIVSLRAAALADLRRVDDPADVATTRPHLAAAMLRLANPRIGEVVVDVACGAGTLVKEAVTHSFSRDEYSSSSSRGSNTREAPFPPRFALGGDVNIASAELCATTNVPAIGANTSSDTNKNTSRVLADVCGWDASRLPLRAGAVDVALGDLPFGKAHLDHRSCARLYPRVLRELARVLRVGGRAVLLGTRSKFNDALDALPLKATTQRLVSKGGLVVLLVALERVPGDERERAPGGGGVLLRKKRHDPERLEARRARARGRGVAGEGGEGGRSGRANGGEPTKNAAFKME